MLKIVRSLYKRIPMRHRIALGLVGLMSGSMLIASGLGFLPNEQEQILKGRAKLCESLAINGSAMIATGQFATLQATFDSLVNRDEDVLSISLRRSSDGLTVKSSESTEDETLAEGLTGINQIKVPIFGNGEQLGELDVRFRSVGGALGLHNWGPAWMLVVMIPTCFVQFSFYLRKTLKQLNPTDSVPQHVQDAFDTLSVGLLLMDANNRILFGNIEFADSIGEERNHLIGVDASTLPWEMGEGSGELPWDQVARTEFPVSDHLLQMDVAGRRRTFTCNCSKVGRGAMATFDDITLLEEARKAAQRANESKSIFLANMSHEIRTPLNAVLGFTDALRRGLITDTDESHEHLNLIYRSGKHLLELINDILDLSKIEAGKMEMESIDTDVAKIVFDTIDVLNVRARQKDLELSVDFESPIPRIIQSDPTRLKQIVTNLIGNAIKFTPDGSVKVVMKMADIVTPKLLIEITDTGIGMTPDHQSRIFESFGQADQSTTRKFGGTGLGLSISKHLTEKLGGTLTVKSELGVGSTFTVSIPVDRSQLKDMLDPEKIMRQRDESRSEADGAKSIQLPPKHVLVVDDGESNRRLIELVLSRAGAKVDSAINGKKALEAMEDRDYALVLMDMQMPVMDGYTAVGQIRSAGNKIPIVALTGNAMKGDREKCLDVGCDDFISKPVDLDKLLHCVAQFIGQLSEDDSFPETPLDDDEVVMTQPHAAHTVRPVADSSIQADRHAASDDFVTELENRLDALQQVVQKADEEDLDHSRTETRPVSPTSELDAPSEQVKDHRPTSPSQRASQTAALLTKIRDIQQSIDVVPPDWPSDEPRADEPLDDEPFDGGYGESPTKSIGDPSSTESREDIHARPDLAIEPKAIEPEAVETKVVQHKVVEPKAADEIGWEPTPANSPAAAMGDKPIATGDTVADQTDSSRGREFSQLEADAVQEPSTSRSSESPVERSPVQPSWLYQTPIDRDAICEPLYERQPSEEGRSVETTIQPESKPELAQDTAAADPPSRNASRAVPIAVAEQPIHSSLPMDDPDFREIVIDFVGRLDGRLAQMQQLCDQQQFDELRKEAHWLKGSAGTVGYAPLGDAGRKLEHAATAEQADEASQCMQDVMAVRRRLVVPGG